mmetsp:Transcript_2946/g.7106  ORF Transcript_2946/g.7106 Transcript_2946/m.7106 type:complete len:590 (+) Transcript_2946:155-1924(+)
MRRLTALRGARQLLGLAAIARGAFWNKKPAQDAAAAAPAYVLTEEHHHVLPHLLALVAEGKVRKRATLVHLDSHHDAGLPSNWNHEDKEHDTQLAHTHINNFLFALGLLEAVEHVIFVEPPWSRQCVSLHNRTKALRLGFIEGAPRVSYDATPSEQRALGGFFDDHQVVDDLAESVTVRFSVVALSDAPHMISKLVGDSSDVILDVDLDAYATTSPGALALRSAGLDPGTIRRLYRLAHDMCVFDETYDFSQPYKAPNCKAEPLGSGPVTRRRVADELRDVVDSAERASSITWTDARRGAVAATLRPFSSQLQASFNVEEKMKQFIAQPFNDNAGAVAGVGKVLRETINKLERVRAVTAVRSPFYAPAELLSVIECQAFGLFREIFGDGGALRYHDGVRANRTGCLARHPHDDHDTVGAFRHIETMELREEDVDDLFFSEEESDEVVEARFVNDGDEDVDIYWRVLKLETLEAGKETAFETTAGSRWSFRRGDDVLKSVRVGRAARNVYALQGQSLDAHPVEMTFVTPSDARVVFDVGEGEVEYEGDRAHPVETYHGHVWRAYDMMGNLLGSFTVNAAEGHRQEFRTEL